jgi:hypothetical protein
LLALISALVDSLTIIAIWCGSMFYEPVEY